MRVMVRKDQDGDAGPGCNGTGEVLLLVSWAKCPDCDGTGLLSDESRVTGEYPIVKDKKAQGSGEGSDEGSDASARCDDSSAEAYFDDGLEFDDDDDGWDPA